MRQKTDVSFIRLRPGRLFRLAAIAAVLASAAAMPASAQSTSDRFALLRAMPAPAPPAMTLPAQGEACRARCNREYQACVHRFRTPEGRQDCMNEVVRCTTLCPF